MPRTMQYFQAAGGYFLSGVPGTHASFFSPVGELTVYFVFWHLTFAAQMKVGGHSEIFQILFMPRFYERTPPKRAPGS